MTDHNHDNCLRLDPHIAHAILRTILRDLRERQRDGGARIHPWVQPALQRLADIADNPTLPGSGTNFAILKTVDPTDMVPVDEAADMVNRSPEYIRRLARTGRIRAERIGQRSWVVDPDSLRAVIANSKATPRRPAA